MAKRGKNPAEFDSTAPLRPADHVLAHAIDIHLHTVVQDQAWAELVEAMMHEAIKAGHGRNSYAVELVNHANEILTTAHHSAARARADHNAREFMRGFHQWRLGLAAEKMREQG